MKIKLNFGNGVVSLPEEASLHFGRAQKEDIMVLIELAGNKLLCRDTDAYADECADAIGISRARFDEAIAFWRGTGILDISSSTSSAGEKSTAAKVSAKSTAKKKESHVKAEAETENEVKKPLRRRDELPNYTTEELTKILEGRDDTRLIIDEAQRVVGKIFNTSEANIIVGLTDYLDLDGEYILLLISHCVTLGKKSLRYIEKTAIGLCDNGITTVGALEEYIARAQKVGGVEGKIRKMFGVGERELTAREREFLQTWICVYGADIELIRAAYEATVNATGKAGFAYAGKILERWHSEGIHTFAELERAKDKEAVKTAFGNSFDTDEFFRAAVSRGFDED